MNWERYKFIIELELKKFEIEKERLLKWISFLQTAFLITISATIGIAYKGENPIWGLAGTLVSAIIFFDLTIYYRKMLKIESKIEEIKNSIRGEN